MITRKEFKRQYQAELLSSSAANYAVGDIWSRVGLTDRLVPVNENIGYLCGDDALSKALEKIQKVKANFPDIDLTDDVNSDIDVQLPSFNVSLQSGLQVNKVLKMIIKGVTSKNSLNGFRSEIVEAVEALKKSNINKYRKYVKSKEIVIALFYAESVEIQISKKVMNQNEFKLKIQEAFKVKSRVSFDAEHHISIFLSNPDCPFAVQLEAGRDI